MSKAASLAGFATAISPPSDLTVGIITATTVNATTITGAVSGTATGLSGTPDITVRNITGVAVTFSGNVSIGGTLTYEDVTNVDSVGLITARSGIILTGGDITLGTGTTISSPASNTFTVSTNGSERVRVDSSGRLAIGTTNPAGTGIDVGGAGASAASFVANPKLGIAGDVFFEPGSGNDVEIFNYRTTGMAFGVGGAEKARIDSSGRLLVGTSNSASAGAFSQYALVQVRGNSSNAASSSILSLQRGEGASSITVNESLGLIDFADNAGNSFGFISCDADGTAGSGDYPGRLTFSTTPDGSATPVERMTINSAGTVRFNNGQSWAGRGTTNGITTPDWRVYNSTSNQFVIDNYSVGVKLDNGATAWSTVSDERQKTNLQPIENGLNKVSALRAVTGRYLVDAEDISRAFLIAQDVQAVLPEAVSVDSDEDSTLGLRYTEVIPLLVAALKESKERIETLEAEVAALKAQ